MVLKGCKLVTAKKGLTKSQMATAEAKYRDRKKSRQEREDREREDYEMIRKGYMKSEEAKSGHRVYPKNFGSTMYEDPEEEKQRYNEKRERYYHDQERREKRDVYRIEDEHR